MTSLSPETIEKLQNYLQAISKDPTILLTNPESFAEVLRPEEALPAMSLILSNTDHISDSTRLASIIQLKQIFVPYFNQVSTSQEKSLFGSQLISVIKLAPFSPKIKKIIGEILRAVANNLPPSDLLDKIEDIKEAMSSLEFTAEQKFSNLISLTNIYESLKSRVLTNGHFREDADLQDCFHTLMDTVLDYQSGVLFPYILQVNPENLEECNKIANWVSYCHYTFFTKTVETISKYERSFASRMFSPEIVFRLVNFGLKVQTPIIRQFLHYNIVCMVDLTFIEFDKPICKRYKGSEISAFRDNFFTLYGTQIWALSMEFMEQGHQFECNKLLSNNMNCELDLRTVYLMMMLFMVDNEVPKSISQRSLLHFVIRVGWTSIMTPTSEFGNIYDNPTEVVNKAEEAVEAKRGESKMVNGAALIQHLCAKNGWFYDFFFNMSLLIMDALLKNNSLEAVKTGFLEVCQANAAGTLKAEELENDCLRELAVNGLLIPEAMDMFSIGEDFQYIESSFLFLTATSDLLRLNTWKINLLANFLRRNWTVLFQIPDAKGQLIIQRFYMFFMYSSTFICSDDFELFTAIVTTGFQYLSKHPNHQLAVAQILRTYSAILKEEMFLRFLMAHSDWVLETLYGCIETGSHLKVFNLLLDLNNQTPILRTNKLVTFRFIKKLIEWLKANPHGQAESVLSSLEYLKSCTQGVHKIGLTEAEVAEFAGLVLELLTRMYETSGQDYAYSEDVIKIATNTTFYFPDSDLILQIIQKTVKYAELALQQAESVNGTLLDFFETVINNRPGYAAELTVLGPLIVQSYLLHAKKANFKAFSSHALLTEFFLAHGLISQPLQLLFADVLLNLITTATKNQQRIFRYSSIRHKFEQQLLMFAGIGLRFTSALNLTIQNRMSYVNPLLIGLYICISANSFYANLSTELLRFLIKILPVFATLKEELVTLTQLIQMFLVYNFRKPFPEFNTRCEDTRVFVAQILKDKLGLKLTAVEDSSDEDEPGDSDKTQADDSDDDNLAGDELTEGRGTGMPVSCEEHAHRYGISKQTYLNRLSEYKNKSREFIDEYLDFRAVVEALLVQIGNFSADNYNIDFQNSFKELSFVSYRNIDGKMVIRKQIKLHKK